MAAISRKKNACVSDSDLSPRMKQRLHQYTTEIENGAAHQAAVRELGREKPRSDRALAARLAQCQGCAVVPCGQPFCVASNSCKQLGIERARVARAWYTGEPR
jgi:hypothetical protein